MKIASFSLDRKTLEKLDGLQRKLGAKSRSRIIGQAVDALGREMGELEGAEGEAAAVITVTYKKHGSSGLHERMAPFGKIIKTELHQHSGGTCARVLIVEGNAERIRELYGSLGRDKAVRSVKASLI